MLITDLNEAAGQRVVESSEAQGRIKFVKADVGKREDWERVVKEATKESDGQLHVVVNNAGISYRNKVSCNFTLLLQGKRRMKGGLFIARRENEVHCVKDECNVPRRPSPLKKWSGGRG